MITSRRNQSIADDKALLGLACPLAAPVASSYEKLRSYMDRPGPPHSGEPLAAGKTRIRSRRAKRR
jgi:hypothetical protein